MKRDLTHPKVASRLKALNQGEELMLGLNGRMLKVACVETQGEGVDEFTKRQT